MKQIVLIGMPRSGKSTCGQEVAKRLLYTFIDIDQEVEKNHGEERHKIYHNLGKEKYRSLEAETFLSASQVVPSVISTGGGTPLYTPRFQEVTTNSLVIFLYCHFDVLWERLKQESNFPPPFIDKQAPKDSFHVLYRERLVHYLRLSDMRIDVTKHSSDQVVEQILLSLRPA